MIDYLIRKYSNFLLVIPISLLAFILLIKGLTYTYDSYNFLCGASSFNDSRRVLMCDNSFMVLSPPGFSIYLSFFLTKAKSLIEIYKVFSLIIYGLTLFCWVQIIKSELNDSKFSGIAILILFGLPLFYIHLFLWSEGIFLLLFSLGVLSLINFNKNPVIIWLLVASFSFGLSITIRYTGIILYMLFFTGWFCRQKIKLKKEHLLILCLPLIVVAFLAGWNFFLDNTFFGERPFSNRDFLEVLKLCSMVICNWIIPVDKSPGLFCILTLTLGLFLFAYFNKTLRFWLLPLVGYFFFISYSAYRTDIEYDERLFVPVYPIFILCVFKSLSQLPKAKFISWVVLVFLIYWSLYSTARLTKNILMWIN